MSDFRSFVAEKELEWKSALNQQIALLEQSLASREAQLQEERKMSAQLKADFKYNLRLVQERDSELTALERENAQLKQQCLALEDKLTSASVKLDEREQALAEESHARAKLADQLKSATDAHERELQLARHERDLEVSRARDEAQALRRQLEGEATRCRRELEMQKRELTGAFDRRVDELQAGYNERAAQLEKATLDWELKCDLLAKDCASLQKSRRELLARLEASETEAAAMEKRLAESEARSRSDLAVLENEKERLQELQAALEVQHRAALDRLEAKLATAQAAAARGEELAAAGAAKQREEKQAVRAQTTDLLGKLHEAEASFQRKANEFEDTLRDRDEALRQLAAQVEELHAQLAASKAEIPKLFVDKDVELDRLRRQLASADEESRARRADLDRYRRELEAALERERASESARQQQELDHQRRTGELEALQYAKSEGYIERLTQARNEALQQLDELKDTLAQKQTFIQSLLQDRETALRAMKEHGISLDRRMESKTVEQDQLAEAEARARDLAQQNEALKAVVKQMRQDMESVEGVKQQHQPASTATVAFADIRSAQELSNVLAKLRGERTDLLAQCRKQQARIAYLEARLEEGRQERAAADTAAEQLRYQLSAQERHHATESAGLRRRLQEAEAQLDESQREADEYYKANIEQGKLAERLQSELLQLKAAAAASGSGRRPGEVNFGAQELYIQQLQDEIAQLRDRMRARQLYGDDDAGEVGDGQEAGRLRAKLKMAAGQIKKLARENQALVDLSNRLRAELNGAGGGGGRRPTAAAAAAGRTKQPLHLEPSGQPIELESHARSAVKDAVGGMTDRLRELERMQYYLTREELARQNAASAAAAAVKPSNPELGDSQPVKDPGGGVRRAQGLRATVDSSLNLAASSVGGGGESLRDVWRLLDSGGQETARGGGNQALNSLRAGTHRDT